MKELRFWIAAVLAAIMTSTNPDIKELMGTPAVLLFFSLYAYYMAWICIGMGISQVLRRRKE
jgi:hypothetical protein